MISVLFSIATNPAKAKSRKPADSPFTINDEGKLVIGEEMEGEGAESSREAKAVDEDMDVDEVMLVSHYCSFGFFFNHHYLIPQSVRMSRKRKRLASQAEDEDDDDTTSRPTPGGKVGGGKGIHRLNAHRHDYDFNYGSEYRAKVSCVYDFIIHNHKSTICSGVGVNNM